MLDALPTVDRDFRDIREFANRIARLVRDASTLSPAAYQELAETMTSLARLWRAHTDSFAKIAAAARSENRHQSIFIAQLLKDSSALADQLELLSGAGWPRTASLGLSALRMRAPELLAAIFQQIEKERSVLSSLAQQQSAPSGAAERAVATLSSIPS
jgi:hypothetical protein